MSERLYEASKALVVFLFVVYAVVAACALMPDYHEITVSYGEGDLDPDSDARSDFDSSEAVIAYTIGWAPGARARHRELIRETERAWKENVAAVDRSQLAFLTGKPVAGETDALGDPIDALFRFAGEEQPKTISEALVLLITAVAFGIAGVTFWLLRRQHRARQFATENPSDS